MEAPSVEVLVSGDESLAASVSFGGLVTVTVAPDSVVACASQGCVVERSLYPSVAARLKLVGFLTKSF